MIMIYIVKWIRSKESEGGDWCFGWIVRSIWLHLIEKKKKENENKFGEEKMLRKSKEKEGKGKELGVVMELNRRENTKEKVLFDLFLFY